MLLASRPTRPTFVRNGRVNLQRFLASESPKSTVKLVAELRKLTDISIVKAKEALVATNNDLDAAIQWLQKDLAQLGVKKAAKLQGRVTGEGLIGTNILSKGYNGLQGKDGRIPLRAAIVELNCETDFVARNELFSKLVADIAHTAAFISEESSDTGKPSVVTKPFAVDLLLDAPLLSDSNPSSNSTDTVRTAIQNTVAKVGEKISLRRAAVSVLDEAIDSKSERESVAFRVASYVHGGVNPSQGRIGTLMTLKLNLPKPYVFESTDFFTNIGSLERSLARQIVGFETRSISSVLEEKQLTLYEQPFTMLTGTSAGDALVKDVLQKWANEKVVSSASTGNIKVWEFIKWTVGEQMDSADVGIISDTNQ